VTTISFSLPVASYVELVVYNIRGQKVTTIADGFYEAGLHNCTWNGSQVASGVYFYRIETLEYIETRKMVLLK
jgi:flagellar hook assembly protein FlgD